MTPSDLARIEAVARRARVVHPGEWDFSWGDGGVVEMRGSSFLRIVSCEDEGSLSEPDVMGPYLALCHPDVVLALVERIRELETQLSNAEHVIQYGGGHE